MSRVGLLVRFVAPLGVLYVTGCADGTGADLVAPDSDSSPTQACAVGSSGVRPSVKCGSIVMQVVPGHEIAQRV